MGPRNINFPHRNGVFLKDFSETTIFIISVSTSPSTILKNMFPEDIGIHVLTQDAHCDKNLTLVNYINTVDNTTQTRFTVVIFVFLSPDTRDII